jgi:hypothetical protein
VRAHANEPRQPHRCAPRPSIRKAQQSFVDGSSHSSGERQGCCGSSEYPLTVKMGRLAKDVRQPQVPLFVCGGVAVASLSHPNLALEGCLWFPDLTKHALDLRAAYDFASENHVFLSPAESEAIRQEILPMGKCGVLLPVAFWLFWQHNILSAVRNGLAFLTRLAFQAGSSRPWWLPAGEAPSRILLVRLRSHCLRVRCRADSICV